MRIGIAVVAYNAESTLLQTLDRIPADFRPRIAEIIICDDASHDDTFEHGRQWAVAAGHAPRHTCCATPRTSATAATRRRLRPGHRARPRHRGAPARRRPVRPGMPPRRWSRRSRAARCGRRLRIADDGQGGGQARRHAALQARRQPHPHPVRERASSAPSLTEFHSGYRAYRTDVLQEHPVRGQQRRLRLRHPDHRPAAARRRHAIVEIPIPTYYGDEICYVNGMKYAADVVRDVLEYRLAVRGFGTSDWVPHARRVRRSRRTTAPRTPSSWRCWPASAAVPDPGPGLLGRACWPRRCAPPAIAWSASTMPKLPGVRDRTDRSRASRPGATASPPRPATGYDVVIAGDVIEHLPPADELLRDIRARLAAGRSGAAVGAQLRALVPARSGWRWGLRVRPARDSRRDPPALLHHGDRCGRLVRAAGFDILEETATGLPLDALGSDSCGLLFDSVDAGLVRIRPTLFAYQYLLRLTPHAESTIYFDHLVSVGEEVSA